MSKKNELIEVAMEIILHAGNARNQAEEACNIAKKGDFEEAKLKMKDADSALLEAHKAQTKIIQDEARGIKHEPSLLFNHAQDTLMTIITEVKLTKEMIEMFQLAMNSK